jgi:hypothetical protein
MVVTEFAGELPAPGQGAGHAWRGGVGAQRSLRRTMIAAIDKAPMAPRTASTSPYRPPWLSPKSKDTWQRRLSTWVVNLLAVMVVTTALFAVLTLLCAGVGAPPETPALCALRVGLVALGVALTEPHLWNMLAAPVVDVVANLVQ